MDYSFAIGISQFQKELLPDPGAQLIFVSGAVYLRRAFNSHRNKSSGYIKVLGVASHPWESNVVSGINDFLVVYS